MWISTSCVRFWREIAGFLRRFAEIADFREVLSGKIPRNFPFSTISNISPQPLENFPETFGFFQNSRDSIEFLPKISPAKAIFPKIYSDRKLGSDIPVENKKFRSFCGIPSNFRKNLQKAKIYTHFPRGTKKFSNSVPKNTHKIRNVRVAKIFRTTFAKRRFSQVFRAKISEKIKFSAGSRVFHNPHTPYYDYY